MIGLQLREGQVIRGPHFNEAMRVETERANGPGSWVAGLVGLQTERFRNVTLTATDIQALTSSIPTSGCRSLA
jgi:hypothetical protein